MPRGAMNSFLCNYPGVAVQRQPLDKQVLVHQGNCFLAGRLALSDSLAVMPLSFFMLSAVFRNEVQPVFP